MIAYLIMKTSRNLKCKLDRELKPFGITSTQFSVMNQIELDDNKTIAHIIAQKLGYDRPTISAIVHRLYTSNIITKIENPADRRTQFLVLTAKGLETLHQIQKVADDISTEVFSSMPTTKYNLLIESLNNINNKLEVIDE